MKEGVNDYDESFVNTQTVLNLEVIWSYRLELIKEAITYKDLLKALKQK